MTTTTANLNLRPHAGIDNDPLLVIPNGSTVTVTGDPWYPVEYDGTAGWVSGAYLNLSDGPPPSAYLAKLMPLTEQMLGLWYHYGQNFTQEPFSAKRGDCSGFIGWTANECGYQPGEQKLYNYSANQMLTNYRTGNWAADVVEEADLAPGDIVFYGYTKNGAPYAAHVVYGLGNGRVRGASGGFQATITDADAQRVGAKVRDDDLHFHRHGIVGIYRPRY